MSKYIEEVIQEFEKKFCKSLLGYDLKFLTSEERANINQLKEFIQSALQKQIEMIEGEVENIKMFTEYDDYGLSNTEKTIVTTYNKATDDTLSILNQYK